MTSGVSREQKMVHQHFGGGFRHKFGSWLWTSLWDLKSRRLKQLKLVWEFGATLPSKKQSTILPGSGQSATWEQRCKCTHVESKTAHIYISSSSRDTWRPDWASWRQSHITASLRCLETRPCNMTTNQKQLQFVCILAAQRYPENWTPTHFCWRLRLFLLPRKLTTDTAKEPQKKHKNADVSGTEPEAVMDSGVNYMIVAYSL